MSNYKYFTKEEFACPCGNCENKISDKFISLLDELREFLGKPLIINSGYRCEEHNKKIGGRETSAHLSGLAADISCTNSTWRSELLRACLARFNRVGVAKSFIHVDIDSSKPQDVLWVYN